MNLRIAYKTLIRVDQSFVRLSSWAISRFEKNRQLPVNWLSRGRRRYLVATISPTARSASFAGTAARSPTCSLAINM
jgi:hypothetical protein